MKHILMLIIACLALPLVAQIEKKKVVVIKKEINDNGKVSVEEKRAEGAEADKLIEEMKKKGEFENVDIEVLEMEGNEKKVRLRKEINAEDIKEVEENLEVESTMDEKGNVKSEYTLTRSANGEVEVIKWDGEGDPPVEMKKVLDETEVHTIIKDEKGNEEIEVTVINDGKSKTVEKKIVFTHDVDGMPINKASLGVGIDDSGRGVIVNMVVPGSGAEGAGLKVGDTILQIEGQRVFSLKGLMEALNPYKGGEKINILYLRGDQEVQTTAILQQR